MAKAKKRAEKQDNFTIEEKKERTEEQKELHSLSSSAADKFHNILLGFIAAAKKFPVLTILLFVLIGSVIGFMGGKESMSLQGPDNNLPSVEYWYTSNATKLTDTAKQELKTNLGMPVSEYLATIIQQPLYIYKDKQKNIIIARDTTDVFAHYYFDTKKENVLTYLSYRCIDKNDKNSLACYVIIKSCIDGDANACKYNKTASDKIAEIQAIAQQKIYDSVPKADKPKVEMFVMSHCPYGFVGMQTLSPIAQLFGDKIDAKIKFVNYLMHGEIEKDDNTLIYCIQNLETAKTWAFIDCFTKERNSAKCVKNIGLDSTKLNSCINETNDKYNITVAWNAGGTYPKYPLNNEECAIYGVRGSPTLVINGQTTEGDWRSPEKLKTFICAGFNNPPEECKQKLGDTGATASGGCNA
ncbi:MAG: hypothetical protein COW47_01995 [Candidatus Huberarchaeum crystalense]|uniref:Thioredoxin-like fold domain-containing protein n=1 Tax=Huberarchaeum crystalense TaxID=2014257 RepID=A0A2G9LJS0_HUBC1|nr:hypothetical protein [archaeon]OIP20723.1 MAG: hypothetical protein AUJ91_00395 [archaeon CG2_30_31_98]PIN66779.1 MAG: hypothetical protein COW69_00055 [Candidatus Huberarchaeum crystalense]NCS98287.1 hypothetical protein [archaeon]PIV13969.1 MAG: hypothetical protein COS45_00260 [Candidatus Huberarchaeum crystalense]